MHARSLISIVKSQYVYTHDFQLEREYHGMTPLVVACLKGNKSLQVVTTLLELGANVNHGLPPFATPLAASMEGYKTHLSSSMD